VLLSLCESIFVSRERRNRESFAGAANREFRVSDGRETVSARGPKDRGRERPGHESTGRKALDEGKSRWRYQNFLRRNRIGTCPYS